MKLAIVLLTLSLLAAPIAVAQGDGGGSQSQCGDDETSQECKKRACEANPDRCNGQANSNQTKRPEAKPTDEQKPQPIECEDCSEARFVSFERDGLIFTNFTVGGRLILDSLTLAATGEYDMSRHGRSLVIEGDEWKLVLHDNPTGLISFKGEGKLVMDFASQDVIAKGEGYAVKFDGFTGLLSAKSAQQDDDVVTVSMAAQFHINKPESQFNQQTPESDKVRDAIEQRRVGAEVKLRAHDAQQKSEVFAYDDMEVVVDSPAIVSAANPMRITVSAELAEGRTIIIDVDPEALTGPELDLHYYDIFDDGTETEIVFRMADGIEDILDATDDAGQPEYWVIKDANGIQVMASIPHWSTHAITIASIGEFVTQPSVLIGIGAGVAGVAIASLTMLRPRRDEL